jgi:signal peptidase II
MYNESQRIFQWFYLYFIENEGMAFGMSLGGDSGKLILTLFRIIAAIAIGYYLIRIVNQKAHPGFIIAMSLIFAGAVGNIIDSVFYGKIFFGEYAQQCFSIISSRRRICKLAAWQSCRYVLLPIV